MTSTTPRFRIGHLQGNRWLITDVMWHNIDGHHSHICTSSASSISLAYFRWAGAYVITVYARVYLLELTLTLS